ncbi:putative metallocarboxypeptidase ecm14 [Glarea lozoyensis 74030]|uniref:Inactive metallocarboxypeptidase ECM14 n=1 Tax=Glarea lozoyensis (strain ATCC 74030 / MF5533) TaxID=1104152 RepID=H0EX01_GLAL7|nr:putative metallocarboxypeptidase ecm14 [Glarea lozoyensis 74030]
MASLILRQNWKDEEHEVGDDAILAFTVPWAANNPHAAPTERDAPSDQKLRSVFPQLTWIRDTAIEKIFRIPKKDSKPDCHKSGPAFHSSNNQLPARLLAKYGDDVVLRFNLTTSEEEKALAEAADILFLDVWEFTNNWADIRLRKDDRVSTPFGYCAMDAIDGLDVHNSYPPSLENLEELGMGIAKAIRIASGEQYTVASACEGAVSSASGGVSRMETGGGSAIDWFYHELKVRYSYQIKLRDTGSYGFLLPKENIVPTGEEAFNAIKYFGDFLLGNRGIENRLLPDVVEEHVQSPSSEVLDEDVNEEEVIADDSEDIKWDLRRRR